MKLKYKLKHYFATFTSVIIKIYKKMEKQNVINAEVEMVNSGEGSPKLKFTQCIKAFKRLGKEIKISPKSHCCLNVAGYKAEYFVETVSICIGIGKDHTAELIMTKEAYDALNSGEKVEITTTEQFKEKYG